MRFKTIEERYLFHHRREHEMLQQYLENETLMAEILLDYFKRENRDMPDDIYRAVIFFVNSEYKKKPLPLVLLYEINEQWQRETPPCTKETAYDQLCHRFQVYGAALFKGNY